MSLDLPVHNRVERLEASLVNAFRSDGREVFLGGDGNWHGEAEACEWIDLTDLARALERDLS